MLDDALNRLERKIDIQVDSYSQLDQKAEYVLRTSGVIIGAVVTALSLSGNPSVSSNIEYMGSLGILSLFLAIALSIATSRAQQVNAGTEEYSFQHSINTDTSNIEYKENLITAYTTAVSKNNDNLRVKSRLLETAQIFFLVGLFNIAIGFWLHLRDLNPIIEYAALIAGVVAFLYGFIEAILLFLSAR